MISRLCRLAALAGLAILLLATAPAHAVPSFALQTGQPCAACHVGAFGPQLTAFGRAFKIGGYVQTGGDGWQSRIPVSAMLLGSYTNTEKGQSQPASEHYGRNGNIAMDQISVFLAGRITDNVGGFVQGTFSGITSTFKLDNTDLRAAVPLSAGDAELLIGADVNNGPTVQDPFGASYAWGFPYVASALTPTPTAQPLLAGGLAGNSIGATLYAWYDRSLYLEAGLYNTYGPTLLTVTGNSFGPGATASPAPYVRAAYEWNWGQNSAYVGAIFLDATINPTTAPRVTTGANGRNGYRDYVIDGGYQFLGDGTHVFSVLGLINHEEQRLNAAYNNGGSDGVATTLNQFRLNASYYYQQTYGATIGWTKSWGSRNTLLYPQASRSGSANGKPDSNAFILEADYVPFGKAESWAGPWANLKLGAQYTIYTQFNGGSANYDGAGHKASDNNTLYLFAWVLF